MSNALRWDILVSAQILVVTNDLPLGMAERRWSPISSTLISGERDAVLVDTFITLEQNRTLVEWIAASGKNLTTIYADTWPWRSFLWRKHNSRAIPEGTVRDSARRHRYHAKAVSSPVLESFWKSRFPGQIDSTLVIADELAGTIRT